MSKESLQKVIDSGAADEPLNDFFHEVSDGYREVDEPLETSHDRFINARLLGEITFSPVDKLAIVTADVTTDLTERSGKKAQYEFARKLLRDWKTYDGGIFIFKGNKKQFRFSLVYTQYQGPKRDFSNFRRFTYYVDPEQTNKTFRERIGQGDYSSLEKIKEAFSVEKVTKAFYTDIANWYFWAVQSSRFPNDAENEPGGRNVAVIRLITRMIFIWFMKERELVPLKLFKKDQAQKLLVSLEPEETTYYKAILQNLFFATLNTKQKDRKFRFTHEFQGKNNSYMDHSVYRYENLFRNREDMLIIFKDIPFLNGGLFDCLDWPAKTSGTEVRFDGFTDKDVGLSVPNHLFISDVISVNLNTEYGTKGKKYTTQGLLNILSSYNFTIDENDPNDQEVALDPEMLGKIFENLLASFNPETATTARKATGSYYTPREIVDYMVTQSLKQYYQTHLSNGDALSENLDILLAPLTDDVVNPFDEETSKEIVRLTEQLRIVDPAVGSGAFPMGILNKLVTVLAKVDPNNKLWKQKQLEAAKNLTDPISRKRLEEQIEEQFSTKNSNYGRKLYLIQKCIYGVDIQQIAIEIAKLRFFISLLVDENIDKTKDNWGIEPLPNLDFKLMQGNSLVSNFMDIDLDADDGPNVKLMKDEAEELADQFQQRKSEYQYETDRLKKTRLKEEIDTLIIKIFETRIKTQKAIYFNGLTQIHKLLEPWDEGEKKREQLKKEIELLNQKSGFDLELAEKRLKEFTSGQKIKPFFAWKLYFAEVFREKGGFDIAIANPPYIGEKKNKSLFEPIKQSSLRPYYQGKMDVFYFFFHLALNICRNNGIITFITTNYYLTATAASKLRCDFKSRATITRLVNFNVLKIFEAAPGQHNLITFLTKTSDPEYIADTCITNRVGYGNSTVINQILSWQDNRTDYFKLSQDIIYDGKDCYIRMCRNSCDPVSEILDKIKSEGVNLGDLCNINQGIVTGADKLTNRHIAKYNINGVIGDGIFIYPIGELIQLGLSSDLVKPWYKNSDIKRFYSNIYNSYELCLTNFIADLSQYPLFQQYLSNYKSILTNRSQIEHCLDWWDLHQIRMKDKNKTGYVKKMIFDGPKIVSPQRSNANTFAYNEVPWYASADVYFITQKDKSINLKYVLALLNSRLYFLWLYHRGKRKGEMLELYQVPLSEIPIKRLNTVEQRPFILEVDRILDITKDGDYQTNPEKQAQVKDIEKKIDQMVYDLYGLNGEEITVVEEKANPNG
ncbi:conserved hypothetical protein [Dehalogenimonas lykanthroporepellens BL-DC-9]|nr:conserved hypothetical protein [Dehalogenimonas lykanthroporepellens BL-DC-9]